MVRFWNATVKKAMSSFSWWRWDHASGQASELRRLCAAVPKETRERPQALVYLRSMSKVSLHSATFVLYMCCVSTATSVAIIVLTFTRHHYNHLGTFQFITRLFSSSCVVCRSVSEAAVSCATGAVCIIRGAPYDTHGHVCWRSERSALLFKFVLQI